MPGISVSGAWRKQEAVVVVPLLAGAYNSLPPFFQIYVYNEITAEEYQAVAAELAIEDAKIKPLCDYPLIATITENSVQVYWQSGSA